MLILTGHEQQREYYTKIIFIFCTLHQTFLERETKEDVARMGLFK
jgi:hypothetical protein